MNTCAPNLPGQVFIHILWKAVATCPAARHVFQITACIHHKKNFKRSDPKGNNPVRRHGKPYWWPQRHGNQPANYQILYLFIQLSLALLKATRNRKQAKRRDVIANRLSGELFRLTRVLFSQTGVLHRLTGVLFRLTCMLFKLTAVLFRLTGLLFKCFDCPSLY